MVIDSNLKNNKFTYRLAAQYDLTPRNMVYGASRSAIMRAVSRLRGVETFVPETIKAYTIGSKNRFFDNVLQVNLEAFIWKYKNQ